ncbi:hypothetical protein BH23PAT2_BH23PAT2_07650 [soil metagenome]
MRYLHQKGAIERDIILIIVFYLMLIFMATSAYLMVSNYILQGRLQNGVCVE